MQEKKIYEIVSQCQKMSHSAKNDSLSPFHIFIHCRTQSVRVWNGRIVGSQSESSTKNPHISSANQIRALRHPRALGQGGGPFSTLGSNRLAIAYLNT